MAESDKFWSSSIPFVASQQNKRVDWTDAGVTALAIVATSFFESVADLIGSLWEYTIIRPVNISQGFYVRLSTNLTTGVAGLFDFGPATAFANEFGLIGSLAILTAGGIILSPVIGRILR